MLNKLPTKLELSDELKLELHKRHMHGCMNHAIHGIQVEEVSESEHVVRINTSLGDYQHNTHSLLGIDLHNSPGFDFDYNELDGKVNVKYHVLAKDFDINCACLSEALIEHMPFWRDLGWEVTEQTLRRFWDDWKTDGLLVSHLLSLNAIINESVNFDVDESSLVKRPPGFLLNVFSINARFGAVDYLEETKEDLTVKDYERLMTTINDGFSWVYHSPVLAALVPMRNRSQMFQTKFN